MQFGYYSRPPKTWPLFLLIFFLFYSPAASIHQTGKWTIEICSSFTSHHWRRKTISLGLKTSRLCSKAKTSGSLCVLTERPLRQLRSQQQAAGRAVSLLLLVCWVRLTVRSVTSRFRVSSFDTSCKLMVRKLCHLKDIWNVLRTRHYSLSRWALWTLDWYSSRLQCWRMESVSLNFLIASSDWSASWKALVIMNHGLSRAAHFSEDSRRSMTSRLRLLWATIATTWTRCPSWSFERRSSRAWMARTIKRWWRKVALGKLLYLLQGRPRGQNVLPEKEVKHQQGQCKGDAQVFQVCQTGPYSAKVQEQGRCGQWCSENRDADVLLVVHREGRRTKVRQMDSGLCLQKPYIQ